MYCNVRRLRKAMFLGAFWWFVCSQKVSFLSFPSFEVSVTFLSTSCFLRWETVPTLFELLDPSFPLPCCLFQTPLYTQWPSSHFSDLSVELRVYFYAELHIVCKQLHYCIYSICLSCKHFITKWWQKGRKRASSEKCQDVCSQINDNWASLAPGSG